jgi:hypothetical protein
MADRRAGIVRSGADYLDMGLTEGGLSAIERYIAKPTNRRARTLSEMLRLTDADCAVLRGGRPELSLPSPRYSRSQIRNGEDERDMVDTYWGEGSYDSDSLTDNMVIEAYLGRPEYL